MIITINNISLLGNRFLTYLPAIFVGICLIILGIYLDRLSSRTLEQELRYSVFNQLSVIRAQLEGNINNNSLLVKGLMAAISTEPNMTQERFAALSKPLFQGRSQLKNIAAAPNLTIRYMYPMEGNESAIGLNYRTYPLQFNAVKKAIDLDELIIAGPVNLVQGGEGFIARIPVFLNAEDKRKKIAWGLISAVIDTEKLYVVSGLRNNNLEIDISIRGKDALGEQGAVFFGRTELFNLKPVLVNAVLPYGTWQLAAIPKNGWLHSTPKLLIYRIAMIVIGLLVVIPLVFLGRFLAKQRESESLLRGLFELSPVGIALNDYGTGNFVSVNPSLLKPTGYTLKQFLNLSYWDLTPKEYEEQEKAQLQMMEKTNRYGPYEKEYIRKDGSRYPVLLSGMIAHNTFGKK